jgi:hypothetical protein
LNAEQTVERVRGFDDELHRESQRRRSDNTHRPSSSSSSSAAAFRTAEAMLFDGLKAWQPGVELHPPAAAARQLLQRVANDAGVHGVMRAHGWRVGLLSEMPPEGKVRGPAE